MYSIESDNIILFIVSLYSKYFRVICFFYILLGCLCKKRFES